MSAFPLILILACLNLAVVVGAGVVAPPTPPFVPPLIYDPSNVDDRRPPLMPFVEHKVPVMGGGRRVMKEIGGEDPRRIPPPPLPGQRQRMGAAPGMHSHQVDWRNWGDARGPRPVQPIQTQYAPAPGPAPLARFELIHEMLNFLVGILWLVAYGALLQKLRRDRSAMGLSLQSLFALVIAEANNVGLLVVASSVYGVPWATGLLACDVVTFLLSAAAFFSIVHRYSASYESSSDTFGKELLSAFCCRFSFWSGDEKKTHNPYTSSRGGICGVAHWLTLYVMAGCLALGLQHMRRGHELPFWLGLWECFADSLLALALIPQLHMFWKKRPRRVSGLLGRFVMCMLLARLAALAYWISDVWFRSPGVPGRGVHVVTEGLNVIVLLDFARHYLRAKALGHENITLPI